MPDPELQEALATIETLKDALVHAEERAEEAEKQRDGAMFHIGEVWMQRNRAMAERDTALQEAEDVRRYANAAEKGAASWKAQCAALDNHLRELARDLSELAKHDAGAWPEGRLLDAIDKLAERCLPGPGPKS